MIMMEWRKKNENISMIIINFPLRSKHFIIRIEITPTLPIKTGRKEIIEI